MDNNLIEQQLDYFDRYLKEGNKSDKEHSMIIYKSGRRCHLWRLDCETIDLYLDRLLYVFKEIESMHAFSFFPSTDSETCDHMVLISKDNKIDFEKVWYRNKSVTDSIWIETTIEELETFW